MSDEFDKFSYSLDKSHLESALQIKASLLEKSNIEKEKLTHYHVYAKSLFEKGFTMADISHNEASQEILEPFEIAEKDLNKDLTSNLPPSKKLIANYMKVMTKTKKGLQDKYGDMW